jgi:hypothetical protein
MTGRRVSAVARARLQARWEREALDRAAPITLADLPFRKRRRRVPITKRGPRRWRLMAAE